jgi:hypothetical protein
MQSLLCRKISDSLTLYMRKTSESICTVKKEATYDISETQQFFL